MAFPFEDADGKTVVQVKAPICLSIEMDLADGRHMTQDELCGLVDEIIDRIELKVGVTADDITARRCMMRTPIRFHIQRHWDELPVDELEMTSVECGCFELRGDEEDEEE
jgi:hypothetical protein